MSFSGEMYTDVSVHGDVAEWECRYFSERNPDIALNRMPL
jgi:hypothetical protein